MGSLRISRGPGGWGDLPPGCKQNSSLFKAELCQGPGVGWWSMGVLS